MLTTTLTTLFGSLHVVTLDPRDLVVVSSSQQHVAPLGYVSGEVLDV